MKSVGYIYNRLLRKMRGVALSNSSIHETAKVESGSTVIDSNFDRHSFCGYDCTINNCDIGAFTSIASNVVIGGAKHPMEYVSMSPVFLSHKDSVKAKFSRHNYKCIPKSYVGNDVWVGDGVYIKSGIRIGDGAVIGMGSVVTKDVPDYAIFAGNPARFIRMRFSDETIDGLKKVSWWSLKDEELGELAKYFKNPGELLKRYQGK